MATNWKYPFRASDGKEISNPQEYFRILSGCDDGFFPIGANGLWHGGIHFAAGTDGSLNQSEGIRCIADGEVVAYRIDRKYPELAYDDRSGKIARYSTGFVLVRHKLTLPPEPNTTGTGTSGAATAGGQQSTPPAEDTLVFFSLCMHVKDYAAYETDTQLARPVHWQGSSYVVGEKAKDTNATLAPAQTGINVRDANHAVVGLLPRGTVVTLGAAHPTRPGYFLLGEPGGAANSPPDTTVYVYKAELDARSNPASAGLDSILVLPTAVPVKAGDLLGHLGEYQTYDTATALPNATPARPLLHLEVFAGDALTAFVARSKARAATLDASTRNRLLINPGAKLCLPTTEDVTVAATDSLTEAADSPKVGTWAKAQKAQGEAIWVRRADIAATAAGRERRGWSKFPLQISNLTTPAVSASRVIKRADLDKYDSASARAQDDLGTSWWLVSTAGDSAVVTGWVCEKDHPSAEWKSPWDWPGFSFVTEASAPADQLSRDIHVQGSASDPAEAQDLKQRAERLNSGALFTKLFDLIDQLEKDRQLSTQELRNAWRTPWVADPLSHLIVKYESEWGGPMAKWNELDALMLEGLPVWRSEKRRIEKLRWWDAVGAVPEFPASPMVHYLHPIGLVDNFNMGYQITYEMLRVVFPLPAPEQRLREIVEEINTNISDYKLDSPLRATHFFAQVREEAGAGCRYEEDLNYKPSALISTFSYFLRNPTEAQTFGRTAEHPADQPAIANRAYADRYGNGNVASGDGWRFRGRGLKQLTFRSNYADFTNQYSTVWSDGQLDFVLTPDILTQTKYAVRSAVYFWLRHNLYDIADRGPTGESVDSITAVINLHTDSYANRWAHFENYWSAKVFEN